jgi:tRNA-dihydrouridine synthase
MGSVLTPYPYLKEIGAIFMRHVQLLEKLLESEKFALLHARKIASSYSHGLPNKKEFFLRLIIVTVCKRCKTFVCGILFSLSISENIWHKNSW